MLTELYSLSVTFCTITHLTPNPGPETDFNLGLLVEEAMVLPTLNSIETPALMAHAVGLASV